MDDKSQSAQLRKFAIEVERDHIVDCCEYAEAAELIATLEKQLADALRALAEARRDAERWHVWTQTGPCKFMFGNTPNEQIDAIIAARQPEKDANNG